MYDETYEIMVKLMANKTKERKQQVRIQVPMHRADWLKIWEPEENEIEVKEKGKDKVITYTKYSYTAIFDKNADLSKMRQLAKDVCAREFPDGYDEDDVRSPFRYGYKLPTGKNDDLGFFKPYKLENYPQYKDKITCTFSATKIQPGVVIPKKDANGKWLPLTDKTKLYNGCFCVATVNCYISDYQGNTSIKFGLQNIMVMKDGEPIKMGVAAEDDFGDIDEDEWGEDNSDLLGDDIDMDDM